MRMKEHESVKNYSTRFLELVNQMKFYEDMIDHRIVEKILINFHEKFDLIVVVIEEPKNFPSLGVQELLGSLKSHEQRLERHSEKLIESVFQSKLTINAKIFEKRTLSHEQGEDDSTRGGKIFRARGRGRSSRGRGRENYERKPSVKALHKDVMFARKVVMLRKIIGSKESRIVFNVRSLANCKRILDY
jgi:hypothetical protein